eukprot:TRINITY_DN65344_c0_g1_i1.p1 TRINITY_DN65344_c0_g1~~TRINITY_DN65344_c0_g1_i1.p1  ORF type:complete len:1087 (-),score=246.83 TRINITY_DN65344_c0_g1_i1:518-3778(-)
MEAATRRLARCPLASRCHGVLTRGKTSWTMPAAASSSAASLRYDSLTLAAQVQRRGQTSRSAARGVWRACSSQAAAVAGQSVPGTSARILAETVHAPASDERKYRVVELQNGLQVLLASDPMADVSAASLSVRCGSFQDPDNRLGLAHFHEHMLFLGTEKYPEEDDFTSFLGEHGGDTNAYTMGEYTTYFFKVSEEHFPGAIDRFSQFFVSPLFDASCVEREMNAVNSESANYSTEDNWRLLQLLRSTANKAHPFSRFEIGNLQTLGSEDPQGTRQELLAWNKEHYRAGFMRMAVIAKQDLDELQRSVEALFAKVPQGVTPLAAASEPWPTAGRMFHCVPLKDARTLSICWSLPPQSKHLFAKPELYLAHMLGHEGAGSLHDVLNQHGWVDKLAAGPAHAVEEGQLFTINVSLTPEGDANRETVMKLLFDYVALVRRAGPQQKMHDEIAALQEISFAHKEDAPAPDDLASTASAAMHHFPPSEVLRGPVVVSEWRPDVVCDYLAMLTPERSMIFLTTPDFEAASASPTAAEDGWKRERWYGMAHREQPLTAEQMALWSGSSDQEAEAQGLRLPEPNAFLPQTFALRSEGCSSSPAEQSRLPMEVSAPHALVASPRTRLWHKMDKAFHTPRTWLLAQVHTPSYEVGPRNVVAARILCGMITDDLNTLAYDASCAGLNFSLAYADNFTVSVGGFSDRLPELLSLVVERLPAFLEAVSAAAAEGGDFAKEIMERYEVQRQILLQDYSNLVREEPWSLCSYYETQIMMQGSWHLDEYSAELQKEPCIETFAALAREAFSELQTEIYVHGNATEEEAESLRRIIDDNLDTLEPQPLPNISWRKVTKLPTQSEGPPTIFEYDLAAQNPAQENCSTQNVYQVGPLGDDPLRDACLEFVCHLASTSAYQRLRTEEQLGYIVQATAHADQHVVGMCVLVQGNRLPPKDIDVRIEGWVEDFGREIEEMSEKEFANNIRAVISGRTQRYANLSQEVGYHWGEISSRRYFFDRLATSVATMEKLSKADVQSFYAKYLSPSSLERRKLSVRALGTSAGADGRTDGTVLANLSDIRSFWKSTETFAAPTETEMPSPASRT